MALSKDPAKRRKQLANRKSGPPAPSGNRRAELHGADAKIPRGIEKARADLYTQLAEAAPVRETDGTLPIHDQAAVEITARALARCRSIDNWLSEHGDDLGSDTVHRAYVLLNGASKTLAELLDRLGMSPRSRAALGLDIKRAQAFDLAQHWAEEGTNDV